MTTSAPVERVLPPQPPFDLVNRVMRWLLRSPRRSRRVGEHLLVLHVRGRRSGRLLDVPVASRVQQDGRLLVLTSSVWRLNLRDQRAVEVTLRGVRRAADAELVEDVDEVADVYARLIGEVGRARAGRELGVRVNVDRDPTHDELVAAARRDGLSVVHLTLVEDGR